MDLTAQFAQFLGRAPNPDELAYFQKFIQQEGIQPHEVGLMLQGTPEFQGQQLNRDTQAYGAQLAQGDQGILDRAAATAQSRFAGLGRNVTSAQVGALSQVAQNLAQDRQSAIAAFYGQGLQGNRSLQAGLGQGALERAYGLRDETRQRGYQIEDRNYMKSMYDDYLNQQRRAGRAGALGSMLGMAGGAAAGALIPGGGAMGANIGAQLGGGFGRNAGGLFGGY